jgi:hypothetical protein
MSRSLMLRGAVVLTGAFLLLLGVGALIDPSRVAGSLGVGAIAPVGLATLRADLFGFFTTSGGLAVWAAIRQRPSLLNTPLLLIGMALFGRFVSLALQPFDVTLVPPMVAEALMLAAFVAMRFWGPAA